jgi:threonine dehydratase
MEQTDGSTLVIAPIGGGGMISGTCLTLSNIAPETEIYRGRAGTGRRCLSQRSSAGHIIAYDAPVTIADGLKVPLKELTWHFVSNHVTDILTASEQEIIDAMNLTWQRMKIVMEPSCAVPLATILKNKDRLRGQAGRRHHHRRQCRSEQAALDQMIQDSEKCLKDADERTYKHRST